ncbi:MAG: magnesium transporter CorA family protein [Candidatus Limnocylindrales bacterium]
MSESTSPAPILRAAAWQDGALRQLASVDEVRAAYAAPGTTLWIDVQDPDSPMLAALAACLGLHPLIVEDILERNQRSKIERTGELLHIVAFALAYNGELSHTEIDMVLGQRFLLTAHDPEWRPMEMTRVRRDVATYLSGGADYLLWALVDELVDSYFPVFDRVGDGIEQLQDDVISRPTKWVVERLFQTRRDLLTIRHAISPQREIFNQLTNREEPLIAPERLLYFRDVYDHLIRLTDELDSFRELVSTTLDAYLSTINNNLSDIMKRLTGVTVVLAGIGAVAGIFGMSEAGAALADAERTGFWFITAAIVVGALAAAWVLHRIGWI